MIKITNVKIPLSFGLRLRNLLSKTTDQNISTFLKEKKMDFRGAYQSRNIFCCDLNIAKYSKRKFNLQIFYRPKSCDTRKKTRMFSVFL